MAAEGLRIFVTKVSQNLDEDHLRAYFGAFGELSDCYVPRVPGKAGHKGIGFVTYADHSAGEQVLLQAVHLVAGEEVTVDRATARTEKGGKGKGGDPYIKVSQNLDEDHLRAYFGAFGELSDCYVPRVPGRVGHKGIGFVTYADHGAGEQVLLQPVHIVAGEEVTVDRATARNEKGGKGKGGDPFSAAYAPMRAAPAYKSASAPAAGKGGMAPGVRVFVTKIAPTLEEDSIRAYFGAFGELSDCYMPRVPGRNGHKGIAFVTFVNAREGEQVLASPVHNISGEEVAVDRAVPREEKGAGKGAYMPPAAAFSYAPPAGKGRSAGPPPGQVDDETRRLFITKVPDSVTQDHVRDYFAAYGEIEDVYLPRRFGTSRHKGIAFVSFVYPQSATDVLAAGNEAHYINGEQVVVDRAAPRDAAGGKGGGRSAPYPSGKGGGAGFNAHNMFADFAAYGEIEDVYLPRRFGTNLHKGIAFVSFVHPQSASDVLAAGNEAHYINGEQVVVDRAAPRDAAGGKGGGRSAPYPSAKGGGAGFHNMVAAYASQMGWAPPAQSSYPGVQRAAYGALSGYGKGR
eukprot:CAMPEP_0204506552 /NCGR_PEP_ID=MMETSP0471-20130131/109306_1 /ASSEMBLY_ACC=CAM_ASM_000602 /TAXON_ID=2969 /ORGANISM="Oxyrrhis marina" /LENGTH=569 /DNA_ID=CAMNT_0051511557 /DNA_START=57 /DNA_END=1767 /DNA_ORIENTATION=+